LINCIELESLTMTFVLTVSFSQSAKTAIKSATSPTAKKVQRMWVLRA